MTSAYKPLLPARRWSTAATLQSCLVVLLSCGALTLPIRSQPPDKSGVKSSVISLPTGAGSIEGLGESFEPQLNTGGSSYGVTLLLPPGRAGLAPKVRLAYNSNSGNGPCGIGWSLEFPSIKRQTDKGFPEYDDGDNFVFEGEELVPLNNAGQDWRCENERSFQRMRRIDSNGDGTPDGWEVTERNGTRHTLGRFRGQNNRWSVVEHPEKASAQPFDRAYSWMLDSTTDLHGNRIEYEYLQGIGVLYPERISYGHLEGNVHEVLFQYEERPDAFDDYRPTFSARLDRRLQRVEVRTQGKLVRAYNLGYAYQPGDLTPELVALQSTYLDVGVTLLKRVVQLDRSGNDANFLPPLIFTYSGLDLTKAERRAFASPPALDLADPSGRVQLADLDGDALPDLFATTAEGAGSVQRVSLNRGESRFSGEPKLAFAPSKLVLGSSPVDLAQPNTVVHDPKGKGLVDLSCLMDDGANKRLETFGNRARLDLVDEDRLGFSQENLEATVLPNPPAFVTYSQAATRQMDVNFDKRGDFVNLEPSFGAMKVNTFYIERGGRWVAGESMLPPSYPLPNTFHGPDGQPNPCVQLADMNGDRMLDLVCLAPAPSAAGQRIRVSYWPLCGLGRYAEERSMPNDPADTFEIGDADLRDVFLDDITGDGLADVMVLDGSGPETVLSLRVNIAGQRWSPPYTRAGLPRYAPRDPAAPTIVRLADLNANGSLDLLFRNTAPQDSWDYLELLPAGTPSLMTGIDNGLGKRLRIEYGSAAEDEQQAREAGHPWRTFAPIALQVVRRIITAGGQDLNGDGHEDIAVLEFRYRDPYYDGFEREFRGFAFAQRVDYGDDFLFDPATGLIQRSSGWNAARTPTGQISGPSLVTRYRYYTGAADQQDNDDYGPDAAPARQIDEFTVVGGREEEPFKGLQWVEEQIDPIVLHSAVDGGFDSGCAAAAAALTADGQATLTPDTYVYTRVRQDWTMRRLYRPAEAVPYFADQNADGVIEDYRNLPAPPVPSGRFVPQGVVVLPGSGRSVTFVFVSRQVTEMREANGLLTASLGYPQAAVLRTTKSFDHDDYGNQTLMRELGLDGASFDDERITTTTYAHGGNALSLWVLDKPDTATITDEKGAFVARKVFFYDGDPFVGLPGQIQSRALLNRRLEHLDAERTVQAARSRFDAYGNIEESRDPVGNIRRVTWDAAFRTYAVAETMVVGGGSADLKIEADYDLGFGLVTRSTDLNGHVTIYDYDSFARLIRIVRPGDSVDRPTTAFQYQPSDPIRGRSFVYDTAGNLTLTAVPLGSVSRVTTRQRENPGQPEEFVTATYTDGLSRTLATLEEGALAGTWVVKQATSYNLRGSAASQWLPYLISSGEVPQFPALWPSGRPPATDNINPSVVASDLYYDPQGRVIRSISPPETWGGPRREALTQYLPFQKRVLDEEDTQSGSPHADTPHIEFSDGLGRLIAVEEVVKLTDAGVAGPPTTWRTEYTYDLNDQLTRTRDSQGNAKTMVFDGLKRMTRLEDPDGGPISYTYDDASNLRETVDAKGQRIIYTYDGVDRIKTEDFQDGGSRRFDVEYFYDIPHSNLDLGDGTTGTGRNSKGQLAYVRDLSGETHFSYDARERIEWEVKRVADPLHGQLVSYRTGLAYDSADRLTSVTYPDGDEVMHTYNTRSLLARVHGVSLGNVITSISYRPSGQAQEIFYGNQVKTRYEYDPRLRLTGLETVNAQAAHLVDFEYVFDGASNLRRIDDQRNLAGEPGARVNSQVFTYDNLYRLTRAEYPSLVPGIAQQLNYRYDRIGNLLAQTSDIAHLQDGVSVTDIGEMAYGGTAGRVNRVGRPAGDPPGPHALTSITKVAPNAPPRAYGYDANGNLTQIDGLVCTWDFRDRLVAVENDNMRAQYTYDYTDRRIVKRVELKSPARGQPTAESTIYVNKHFEVREHDVPVKHLWNGEIRVARVTGSLSHKPRIQKLRLFEGWNLVSTRLEGTLRSGGDPVTYAALIQVAFRWDNVTARFEPVAGDDSLPAGTVLWIFAARPAVWAIQGLVREEGSRSLARGGHFLAVPSFQAWRLPELLPESASAWTFESPTGLWHPQLPAPLRSVASFPQLLGPGQASFIRANEPFELPSPPSSLQIHYYHSDHLGSSCYVSDGDGRLIEENSFYPFGAIRHQRRVGSEPVEYLFTQKERDAESRLDYFGARYFTAALGRFCSVDPRLSKHRFKDPESGLKFFKNPQRLNHYAYALNNPLRFTDPNGEDNQDSQWKDQSSSTYSATVELTGIKNSPVDDMKFSIESFSFGPTSPGISTSRDGDERPPPDTTISSFVNSSTPGLMRLTTDGNHIKEATIIVRKPGETPRDKPTELYRVKLTDVRVTSFQMSSGGGGDRPMQAFSLSAAKMEFIWPNPFRIIADFFFE